MNFEKNNVTVFHNSIRIHTNAITIYFDPFKLEEEYHDADIVFITHSHFDHLSKEDLLKVVKNGSTIVFPKTIQDDINNLELEYDITQIACNPEEELVVSGLNISTVPAYNVLKPFHPKKNNWLGYIVELDGEKIYVAGDTDNTKDAQNVKCDIAFVPVGGLYTMDYKEAAKLINEIKPKLVIPTHYGTVAGNKEDGEKFKKLIQEEIECKILIK